MPLIKHKFIVAVRQNHTSFFSEFAWWFYFGHASVIEKSHEIWSERDASITSRRKGDEEYFCIVSVFPITIFFNVIKKLVSHKALFVSAIFASTSIQAKNTENTPLKPDRIAVQEVFKKIPSYALYSVKYWLLGVQIPW
ncbi:hypothetical protein [Nitrosomonas aestuarii]|uniref:hypothetical protein n=1 Tax=Nitrosomonas aestuarii TaxID=52441 RepID=UPI000D31DEB2|nr:hypothetical protein [Nitrosomonas aestuarii]PTN10324.1 hypothetical protein C8R11_12014 [Nitrosomonas aestuarii]